METPRSAASMRLQDAIQTVILLGAIIASYAAMVQRLAVVETKVDFLMQTRAPAVNRN